MICCEGHPFVSGGDTTFEVDTSRIKYGSGALREAGADARDLGMTRVALVLRVTSAHPSRPATSHSLTGTPESRRGSARDRHDSKVRTVAHRRDLGTVMFTRDS
ncbi:MAG: hypothetical protein NVSMB19_03500 [Vulcanimicrobiaceae bacterium]